MGWQVVLSLEIQFEIDIFQKFEIHKLFISMDLLLEVGVK